MHALEQWQRTDHWRPRLTVRAASLLSLCGLLLLAACGIIPSAPAHQAPASTSYAAPGASAAVVPPTVPYLHLPAGFQATVYATGLRGPRLITFGPSGALFVAERATGRILALLDPAHQGQATQSVVVASGLDDPTSVVYDHGALYVGEHTRVTRLTLGADLRATSRQVVVPDLPAGGGHVTRTVLLGGDGALYVASGSSCNVCVETDPHRAAVWRYNPDGTGGHVYATGLRNAVGLAVNPWNHQVWATNNGRDELGDNTPPETVYALEADGDFGWPRCHAGTIVDPEFGHPGACDGVIAPLATFQAHMAPLGLAFYPSGTFPDAYHGLFVAFHGSWNRTTPAGYKVMFVPLDAHGNVAGQPRDFATGWLQADGHPSGRPVGLAVGQDGALYVSDDTGGTVLRIAYTG